MPDDYNNLSVLDRSRHHISADNRQHAAPLINEMRGGNQKEKKTEQNSTVQYSTVQYSTVQYSTVQYSAVQYSTVQHSTVQYSAVQYIVQYSTVQYSTVQYSTVQYSTLPCITVTDDLVVGMRAPSDCSFRYATSCATLKMLDLMCLQHCQSLSRSLISAFADAIALTIAVAADIEIVSAVIVALNITGRFAESTSSFRPYFSSF